MMRSQPLSVEVPYAGLKFTVRGTLHGADEFELDDILLGTEHVFDVLDAKVIRAVEEQALEQAASAADDMRAEADEQRYAERV